MNDPLDPVHAITGEHVLPGMRLIMTELRLADGGDLEVDNFLSIARFGAISLGLRAFVPASHQLNGRRSRIQQTGVPALASLPPPNPGTDSFTVHPKYQIFNSLVVFPFRFSSNSTMWPSVIMRKGLSM